MWSDLLLGYGLFILEILTLILVVAGVMFMIISLKRRHAAQSGELVIKDLSQEYKDNRKKLADFYLSEDEIKQQEKVQKKEEKRKTKAEKAKRKKGENVTSERKPHLYVLDFKGDISASETTALREEISAIIAVAKPEDEVLLRLESPGGVVHGYGLAASQLARLKAHHIKLTVAVDRGIWLGVESELQLPAYTTVTAMLDLSHICDLQHSSQKCQILDPLSEARDQTCNLMDTSQVHYH